MPQEGEGWGKIHPREGSVLLGFGGTGESLVCEIQCQTLKVESLRCPGHTQARWTFPDVCLPLCLYFFFPDFK